MAESFTPISQASPGAAGAIGPTFPGSAAFWAEIAALNFSTEKALAEDQRATRDTNAAYQYNKGVSLRAEPLRLTANRNAANSSGLAESGVLAKTQGTTQTDYAQKGERAQEVRRNAVEKYQDAERSAVASYGLGVNRAVTAAEAQQQRELEENPPKPAAEPTNVAPTNPAVPSNAGGTKTVLGPPGKGGVVPYEEGSPRGWVRVGMPNRVPAKPVAAVRKAAAKKAVTVG